MLVKLTAITPQGQRRDFGFRHTNLESAYDVLLTIAQKGDSLLEVTFIDGRAYQHLPINELNNPDFINPIRSLRQQWETLFAQPIHRNAGDHKVKQRLLVIRQNQLVSSRQTLNAVQRLLDSTLHSCQDTPRNAKLITHYQQIVNLYSHIVSKLEAELV